MEKGVYIFLEFLRKGFQSKVSFIEWAGETDVGNAIDYVNGLDADMILKRRCFDCYSQGYNVSAVIREMSTGKILYSRILYECQ